MPVFDKLMSTKRGRKDRDVMVADDDGPVAKEGEDLLLLPSDDEESAPDIELTDEEDEEDDENQSGADGDDAQAAAPTTTEIEFSEPKAWAERMTLSATKPLPADLNPNDDPKREEVFANHIMLSVKRGVAMLEKAGIKWRRPEDYYAEMVKSDMHMEKIRSSMDESRKRVQEQAHRRNMREQKKFGQEVQADVLRQRAAAKSAAVAKVTDYRKKRGKGMSIDDALDDGDAGGNDEGHGGKRGGAAKGRDQFRKPGKGGAAGARKSLRPGAGGKKKSSRPGKSRRR